MPEASTPSAIAVLPLTTICGSVDRCAGIAYLKSRLASPQAKPASSSAHVDGDDLLVLLAEDARDLLARQLQVEAVDAAQHAEHEHVLAAARIGDQRPAFALQRNLVDADSRLAQRLRPSRRTTRRSSGPRARATCSRAGSSRRASVRRRATRPSSTCSLKATTRSVSSPPLVTRFEPMRMRMPLAPATLRAGGWISAGMISTVQMPLPLRAAIAPERLAAALRALARIADHLDDVLGQHRRACLVPGCAACSQRGRVAAASVMVVPCVVSHRESCDAAAFRPARTRAKPCSSRGDAERAVGPSAFAAGRRPRCRAGPGRPSCRARPCGRRPSPRSRWPRR